MLNSDCQRKETEELSKAKAMKYCMVYRTACWK